MRVSHGVTAAFDDPNLVSCAGLAPVLQLAERAGLQDLVAVSGRLTSSARRLVLHLTSGRPWWTAWEQLADRSRHGPPAARIHDKANRHGASAQVSHIRCFFGPYYREPRRVVDRHPCRDRRGERAGGYRAGRRSSFPSWRVGVH
jgi:hypothetical protein